MGCKINAIVDALRRLADAIEDEHKRDEKRDEIKWYPHITRRGVIYKPSHIPPATMALQIDELGDKYLFGAADVMFINYYFCLPFFPQTVLIFKHKGKVVVEILKHTKKGEIELKMEQLLGYKPKFDEHGKFINPPPWRETSPNWRVS